MRIFSAILGLCLCLTHSTYACGAPNPGDALPEDSKVMEGSKIQGQKPQTLQALHDAIWHTEAPSSLLPKLNAYELHTTCISLRDACQKQITQMPCNNASEAVAAQLLSAQCWQDHVHCLRFDVIDYTEPKPDFDACTKALSATPKLDAAQTPQTGVLPGHGEPKAQTLQTPAESVESQATELSTAQDKIKPKIDLTPYYALEGIQIEAQNISFLPNARTLQSLQSHSQDKILDGLFSLLAMIQQYPKVSAEDYLVDKLEYFIQDDSRALDAREKAQILSALAPALGRMYLEMEDYSAFKQILTYAGSLKNNVDTLEVRCFSCTKIDPQIPDSLAVCSRLHIPVSALQSSVPQPLAVELYVAGSQQAEAELRCGSALMTQNQSDPALLDLALDRALASARAGDAEESVQAAMYWVEALLESQKFLPPGKAYTLDAAQSCKINALIDTFLSSQRSFAAWFVESILAQHFTEQSYLTRIANQAQCKQNYISQESESLAKWYQKETNKRRVKKIKKSFAALVKRYAKAQKWIPRMYLSFIALSAGDPKHAVLFGKNLGDKLRLSRNPQFYGWIAALELQQSDTYTQDWATLLQAFQNRDNSSALLFASQVAPHLGLSTRREFAKILAQTSLSYAPLASALFTYAYLKELAALLPPKIYAQTVSWMRVQIAPFLKQETDMFLALLSLRAQATGGELLTMHREARELMHNDSGETLAPIDKAMWQAALFVLEQWRYPNLPSTWLSDYHAQVLAALRTLGADSQFCEDFDTSFANPEQGQRFLLKYFALY